MIVDLALDAPGKQSHLITERPGDISNPLAHRIFCRKVKSKEFVFIVSVPCKPPGIQMATVSCCPVMGFVRESITLAIGTLPDSMFRLYLRQLFKCAFDDLDSHLHLLFSLLRL